MNCGKVEEPNSSRSQYPSTARFAATSAILTAILSRSDRAPSSSTVSARPGWGSDLNGCGCSLEAFRLQFRACAWVLIDTFVERIRRRTSANFAWNCHSLRHRKEYQMDGTNGLKESTRVATPVASSTLSLNIFTAPGKTMVGERPKPFGEALGFDPITSTLIFGEYDAVLVDAMGTVAEAEALADWVALHNRNLETIYITHAHFDHFYGLSILLDRFPGARAIATPKTVKAMQMSFTPTVERLARRCFPGQVPTKLVPPETYEQETFTLEGHELRIIEQGHTDSADTTSLYVPSIGLIVAGDVVYNQCRMYVGDTRPESRKNWIGGLGPVSSADPGEGRRRSQEAWRARLSRGDRGDQTLPRGLRSAPENRDLR